MFARPLGVIEEAFDARVIRAGKDGKPADLGPDHYARLRLWTGSFKLLTAGRPPTVVSVIAASAATARWVLTNAGTARAAAPGLARVGQRVAGGGTHRSSLQKGGFSALGHSFGLCRHPVKNLAPDRIN